MARTQSFLRKNSSSLLRYAVTAFLMLTLVLTSNPSAKAVITNGSNAVDLLGQFLDITAADPQPNYTQSGSSTTNRLGFDIQYSSAFDADGNRFFVADANNHRILVYNLNVDHSFVDLIPDNVLGQDDFVSSDSGVTASTLNFPIDLEYNGNTLYVSDFGNNRVVVYDVTAITNGEDAVSVLGQDDFVSVDPVTTQDGLKGPRGLAFRPGGGGADLLYVADTSNNRVLVYDVDAITDGENATKVIGQADFVSADQATTQGGLKFPVNVALDLDNDRLFVADTNNLRVLIFDDIVNVAANSDTADKVLGQDDFVSADVNDPPTQASLGSPYGLVYVGDAGGAGSLFVSDADSNRVLHYNLDDDSANINNGQNATNVLGQDDFVSADAATTVAGLDNPLFVESYQNADGDFLVVADSGNHRALFYDIDAVADGEDAASVLGQYGNDLNDPSGIFTKGESNNEPHSASFNAPNGLAYDLVGDKRLFVSDTTNNRVLVYDLDANGDLDDHLPDKVLGQPNFYTNYENDDAGEPTQSGLSSPQGLAYESATDLLYVADYGNNRVMIFDVAAIVNGENAANVFGQDRFDVDTAALFVDKFWGPTDVAVDTDNERLFVVQDIGRRVSVFDIDSYDDGEDAINVLGQEGFGLQVNEVTQDGLAFPVAVEYDATDDRLFVADDGANRVVVYDVAAITNGEDAVKVLGQDDFVSSDEAVTAAGLTSAKGLAYDATAQRLFVSDGQSNRVVTYDVAEITNGESAVNVLGQANFVSSGSATTQAGLNGSKLLAFNSTSEDLLVSDSGNHRVVFYDAEAGGPTVETLSPADGAVDIDSTTTDLVITFNRDVTVNAGNVVVKSSANDAVIETIPINGDKVSGSGTTEITIDVSNLSASASFYVQIDAGAVVDGNNTNYAGIADKTTWNFSTAESNGNNAGNSTGGSSLLANRSGSGSNNSDQEVEDRGNEVQDSLGDSGNELDLSKVLEIVVGDEVFRDRSELSYENEVAVVVANEIITKEFTKPVNKCEALVILFRSANITPDMSLTDDYEDTPDWCAPYARLATDLGIVEGRSAGYLGTDTEMSRFEAAVLLDRFRQKYLRTVLLDLSVDEITTQLFELLESETSSLTYALFQSLSMTYQGANFELTDEAVLAVGASQESVNPVSVDDYVLDYTDVEEIPEWAEEAVARMSKLGYMKGYADGSFSSFNPMMLKQDFAVVIDRQVYDLVVGVLGL